MNKVTKWIQTKWAEIPEHYKVHAKSALDTFVAASVTQLALDIAASGYSLPLEKAALISLLATALRAGWKALVVLVVKWREVRKNPAA